MRARCQVYLLYWYNRTNTDAEGAGETVREDREARAAMREARAALQARTQARTEYVYTEPLSRVLPDDGERGFERGESGFTGANSGALS